MEGSGEHVSDTWIGLRSWADDDLLVATAREQLADIVWATKGDFPRSEIEVD